MWGTADRGRLRSTSIAACLIIALGSFLLAATPVPDGLADASPDASPDAGTTVLEVRFTGETGLRGSGQDLRTRSDSDLNKINALLSRIDAVAARPLVAGLDQAGSTAIALEARRRSGEETINMANWYRISVPAEDADRSLEVLRSSPLVSVASRAPEALPPPPTPDFSSLQLHLDAAPAGTGLESLAADPRTRGAGVKIVDLEYYWTGTHEDLQLPASTDIGEGEYIQYTGFGDEHGTAVFGILVAKNNGFGVTGGVPDATMKGISPTQSPGFGYNPAGALTFLASRLSPGDVVLIEQQADGPGPGSSDFVPMEWEQANFDAIRQLGNLGVIVVETGANGGYDLDGAAMQNRFNRSSRDSDAILVGAGDSVSHAPLWFTSYGSRLDLQGYGNNIVTTGGDGELQGAGPAERDIRYTNSFGGTSGAGPVVASTVVSVLSYLKATGQPPISADQMVSLLRATGTPQASPETGQIGPLPDVPEAIDLIDQSLPSVSVSSPGNQSTFSFDAVVRLELQCDGGGPSLASCRAVDQGPGGETDLTQGDSLPTDQPGVHTVTATAVNSLGLTAESTVSYEVGPGCHLSGVTLASVEARGSRVRLTGAVDPSKAGLTAKVFRNGRKAGTAIVGTDGIIETTVPAPKSRKLRASARYSLSVRGTASSRSRASEAVRLISRKALPAADLIKARLSGIHRKGVLTLKSKPLCGGGASTRRVAYDRRGAFTVKLAFGPATQVFTIRKGNTAFPLPVAMPAARFVLDP